MAFKFTGGNPDAQGDFELIPEGIPIDVTFMVVEPMDQNPNRLKFVYRLDDYDDEDMEEAGVTHDFRGENHWEFANQPKGKLNGKQRIHQLISQLIGHTLKEGEDVELEDYYGAKYVAKFKHVPRQKANGDGSFSVVKDDHGQVVYKAQIADLTPKNKRRKPKPEPEPEFDTSDFEE